MAEIPKVPKADLDAFLPSLLNAAPYADGRNTAHEGAKGTEAAHGVGHNYFSHLISLHHQ